MGPDPDDDPQTLALSARLLQTSGYPPAFLLHTLLPEPPVWAESALLLIGNPRSRSCPQTIDLYIRH